jgi:hypothetical protein
MDALFYVLTYNNKQHSGGENHVTNNTRFSASSKSRY